jgi:hypothetical protein
MVISQGKKCPTSSSQEIPVCAKIFTLKILPPTGNKKTIKPDTQPNSGDDWIPPHASACGLFFHFSANKSPLIFACIPAFDFYLSVEQKLSPPKNSSTSS